jgi:hypothetical protein
VCFKDGFRLVRGSRHIGKTDAPNAKFAAFCMTIAIPAV